MYLEADLDAGHLLDSMAEVLESDLAGEIESPEARQKLFSMAGLLRNIRPTEITGILAESVRVHLVFLEELLEDCPADWNESARHRFPLDPTAARKRIPTNEYGRLVTLQHGLRRDVSRMIVELHERRQENPERAESLLERCHEFCMDRSREAADRIRVIRWDEIL